MDELASVKSHVRDSRHDWQIDCQSATPTPGLVAHCGEGANQVNIVYGGGGQWSATVGQASGFELDTGTDVNEVMNSAEAWLDHAHGKNVDLGTANENFKAVDDVFAGLKSLGIKGGPSYFERTSEVTGAILAVNERTGMVYQHAGRNKVAVHHAPELANKKNIGRVARIHKGVELEQSQTPSQQLSMAETLGMFR